MRFSASAIHFDHLDGPDSALFRVDLPHVRYDGKVRVSSSRQAAVGAEEWIAGRLDELATRIGFEVVCGRLFSPVDLRD